MAKNYWTALTDKGAEYIISQKLTRVQTSIVLYFVSNMDEDSIIAHENKVDILTDMEKQTNTKFHKSNFYDAFDKLIQKNIIVSTENNNNLKRGFMCNPFIAYKGGKKAIHAHIEDFLKCTKGELIQDSVGDYIGYKINEKEISSPFESRMVETFI